MQNQEKFKVIQKPTEMESEIVKCPSKVEHRKFC